MRVAVCQYASGPVKVQVRVEVQVQVQVQEALAGRKEMDRRQWRVENRQASGEDVAFEAYALQVRGTNERGAKDAVQCIGERAGLGCSGLGWAVWALGREVWFGSTFLPFETQTSLLLSAFFSLRLAFSVLAPGPVCPHTVLPFLWVSRSRLPVAGTRSRSGRSPGQDRSGLVWSGQGRARLGLVRLGLVRSGQVGTAQEQ